MSGARDLEGRTVLVRSDLSRGWTETFAAHLRDLATRGAVVAVVAGHDNPAGDVNPVMSLRHLVQPLSVLTGLPVHFVGDCVGPVAEAGLAATPAGSIALLENVRFHPEAQRHSRTFAIRLSVLGDFFSVPGGMPEPAAVWIRELAKLLPEPTNDLAPSA
ncbi:MAG: phosphoglycerate kinase [Hoeflea sp.]|uniref:phosphoglycerate kinase n=1 Tax=Hoeflea sp. TaxID=1940281 RepID=UPI001E024192|nr:phosphoglycerate kinase [Hoeflea sp.]MBU4528760.1 phosphoglycerate kinase [Alphaproteobacteria bacterium]MBU4545913.1 phosphoglycerate kinase [Alphaproteobacteria bacterium]MBU4549894.1 phosphoglycerate kinase [Alphaproteobacteria bacterium]MBV1725891.1 phosphoglycerate kinase [Hoeflea sp.]MBV1762616.1 phosphoglycerate kinase [Hoeflea sp.]